jgi:hypothetical protein
VRESTAGTRIEISIIHAHKIDSPGFVWNCGIAIYNHSSAAWSQAVVEMNCYVRRAFHALSWLLPDNALLQADKPEP